MMFLQIISNSPDSGVDVSSTDEPSTPEGLVLLKSQVKHLSVVNQELREELSHIRNDCLQLQGTKVRL
jgi:hypothetical protein